VINDPTARDYSYVKTPVLDFLIHLCMFAILIAWLLFHLQPRNICNLL
jgi:hypothetical protein